jgi:hypothetical protein
MKEITRYETCDGRLFNIREEAECHERALADGESPADDAEIYWLGRDRAKLSDWVLGVARSTHLPQWPEA